LIRKTFKYLSFLIILVIGCSKKPIDYRNKFCGTYDFIYTEIPWTINNGFSPPIEGKYTGTVYYNIKEDNDIIYINFKWGLTSEYRINKQGDISGCGGNGHFQKRKSVTFEYGTSSCGGGHGGGYYYTVTGTKKHMFDI